jgi:hypothetical protein
VIAVSRKMSRASGFLVLRPIVATWNLKSCILTNVRVQVPSRVQATKKAFQRRKAFFVACIFWMGQTWVKHFTLKVPFYENWKSTFFRVILI